MEKFKESIRYLSRYGEKYFTYSWIPGIFTVLSILVWWFYGFNNKGIQTVIFEIWTACFSASTFIAGSILLLSRAKFMKPTKPIVASVKEIDRFFKKLRKCDITVEYRGIEFKYTMLGNLVLLHSKGRRGGRSTLTFTESDGEYVLVRNDQFDSSSVVEFNNYDNFIGFGCEVKVDHLRYSVWRALTEKKRGKESISISTRRR